MPGSDDTYIKDGVIIQGFGEANRRYRKKVRGAGPVNPLNLVDPVTQLIIDSSAGSLRDNDANLPS